MIHLIAILIFTILAFVALLHAYWGWGGHWPATSRETLPQTVIGSKGIKRMPPFWITMTVAILIFIAALLPISWVFFPILPNFLRLAMIAMAAVFILRGVASFTPYFRNMQSEEPFASLDRKYFGPLCIALGLGFSILLL